MVTALQRMPPPELSALTAGLLALTRELGGGAEEGALPMFFEAADAARAPRPRRLVAMSDHNHVFHRTTGARWPRRSTSPRRCVPCSRR